MKVLFHLLRDIGIEMILPIEVKTDNIDALFMPQTSFSNVIIFQIFAFDLSDAHKITMMGNLLILHSVRYYTSF
jgi:hypothetical protein